MFEESAKDGGEDAKGVKLRTRMQARLGEILARKAEAKNGAAAAPGGKPPAVPSRSPKNKVRYRPLDGQIPHQICGYFCRGPKALFCVCVLSLSLFFPDDGGPAARRLRPPAPGRTAASRALGSTSIDHSSSISLFQRVRNPPRTEPNQTAVDRKSRMFQSVSCLLAISKR
jgi:hypothetical protein